MTDVKAQILLELQTVPARTSMTAQLSATVEPAFDLKYWEYALATKRDLSTLLVLRLAETRRAVEG